MRHVLQAAIGNIERQNHVQLRRGPRLPFLKAIPRYSSTPTIVQEMDNQKRSSAGWARLRLRSVGSWRVLAAMIRTAFFAFAAYAKDEKDKKVDGPVIGHSAGQQAERLFFFRRQNKESSRFGRLRES